MNLIAFPRLHASGAWTDMEREILLAAFAGAREGCTLEISVTESGDPQLYLLGPQPEQGCELCISRTAGRYVLEDGAGRLLVAHRSLDVVAMHTKDALRGKRSWLVARIVLMWCTIRHMIHERVEPVLAESEELLVHFAPQLAVFA
jgi:hypothetical protein